MNDTDAVQPLVLRLDPDGGMPNNPRLPVLLWRAVVPPGGDPAAAFEAMFARNGWPPAWRNGVYPFHHYHTEAHEALGFAGGAARLLLGGPNGQVVEVAAGDAALLPAGVGHCRLEASADFLVVGAYPPGQHPDLCRGDATADMQARILRVPAPPLDPVHGDAAAFARLWPQATA
ncbi:hypothetical protein STAQ_11310 [Allostella sp. ATCC 35155]|nr:hypothetical protein STAQ_11310 [Stella sp. ATCC 35155]